MNGLPYYKAYPRDFIEGTIGLDFETKAAYRLALDLIYMHGGKLPDNARYISGLLGCSVKKWNSLRERLITAKKLYVSGDHLQNYRADKELETLGKIQDKQRENRSHPNKNKTLNSPWFNHTDTDTDIDKKKDANASSRAPAPQKTRFDEFWNCYPHRNGAKKGRADCERVYAKAVKAGVTEQQIIDAAGRAREDPDVKRGYGRSALPWLNQRGWEDEIQPQPNLTVIHGSNHDRQSPQQNRQSAADDRFGRIADAAVRNRAPSGADFGFG